ncbi:acyltransferase family protein [Pseudarthrobacter oxydans]|nr:acyltransferase family protein [Pseudarthrobacter oxydans]
MASTLSAPTQISAKKRMQWMDVMRGAAVLLVILFHTESQISGNLPGYEPIFAIFNDAVAPFRMPTLMLMSGMLLPRSLRKPVGAYLRGKLFVIGWPYLLGRLSC